MQDATIAVDTTVRILRIAAGGDGVGKLADGRTVFVPRTAPGDLVELRSLHSAKRFARARAGRVLEPGPDRADPPCPHYTRDECGGCQLQHLTAAAQLSAKQSIVGEALRRIGHVTLPDPPVMPSPRAWEYRAKITLAVDDRGHIGLHPLDRPNRTFDLEHCPITERALMAVWSVVRRHRRLLPGNMSHLVLRLDRQGGRHLVVQVRGTTVWDGARELSARLLEASVPTILWWEPEGGAPRVLAGAPDAYPATVFEQVHPAMGDSVRTFALQRLGEVRGTRVWDLYAGTGESTEALLAAGAAVESVEADPRAVALAGARARRVLGLSPEAGLPRGVAILAGRVEDLLKNLSDADLILANPPRAGIAAGAIAEILRRPARCMVYISCDPATLARDVARLAARFRVKEVEAFDLFPQTAHVETVAVLETA